jgi:AcrR family transcriptional regulator
LNLKTVKEDAKRVSAGAVPPKSRGRQRSQLTEQKILQATRDVLLDSGYVGFSVNAVVARAGVSTATIYRRWPSSNDLIFAAISSLVPEPIDIDAGSFGADLSYFVDHVGEVLLSLEQQAKADKKDSRVDPVLRKAVANMFMTSRIQLLTGILARAQQRGELGALPDVDHCFSYVAGPLHHRLIIRDEDYTPEFAEEAKVVITAGLSALSARLG